MNYACVNSEKIQQWHVNASRITGELNPPGHNSAKVNLIHLSLPAIETVTNSAQVNKEKQRERRSSQLLLQNHGLMEKIIGPTK